MTTAQPEPNQVLTAGQPLTTVTKGQLCDGDLIREDWNQGRVVVSRYPYGSSLQAYRLPTTTWLGRPDAEGWIPWSGGENPVPGVLVDFVGVFGGVGIASERIDWLLVNRWRPHSISASAEIPTEQTDEPAGQALTADGRLDLNHAGSLAAYIGKSLAKYVSGNNMPEMSGDDRKRIPEHIRRRYDTSCNQVAEYILAFPRPHPVAAEGEVAGLKAEVERLKAENKDLRAIPWPRAYVMERASEWDRLLREAHGYIHTCRGSCGSDMSGRDHALAALAEAREMLAKAPSPSTCGTDGEAGSKPTILPTTQERIALLEKALDGAVRAYVVQADAASNDGYSEIAHSRAEAWRSLIDHREER